MIEKQYTLTDIFNQVKSLRNSVDVSYKEEEAYIFKGIRVSRIDDEYLICNASGSGDNYQSVSQDVLEKMMSEGFMNGLHYHVSNKYQGVLRRLSNEYRSEANTRNNSKTLKGLKNRRDNLLRRYNNLKNFIQ